MDVKHGQILRNFLPGFQWTRTSLKCVRQQISMHEAVLYNVILEVCLVSGVEASLAK